MRRLRFGGSLGGLLGESRLGSLDGASGVAQELGVDSEERRISLPPGLLDAVPVGLLVLVVVRMVLRLCHPFSIYYADYINLIIIIQQNSDLNSKLLIEILFDTLYRFQSINYF